MATELHELLTVFNTIRENLFAAINIMNYLSSWNLQCVTEEVDKTSREAPLRLRPSLYSPHPSISSSHLIPFSTQGAWPKEPNAPRQHGPMVQPHIYIWQIASTLSLLAHLATHPGLWNQRASCSMRRRSAAAATAPQKVYPPPRRPACIDPVWMLFPGSVTNVHANLQVCDLFLRYVTNVHKMLRSHIHFHYFPGGMLKESP
jgi:hypothetical protein